MKDFKITECIDCTTEITGKVKVHVPRRHYVFYSVETQDSYEKVGLKGEALETYKHASAPKELYGVDKYGCCHTIKKAGKFAWEKD